MLEHRSQVPLDCENLSVIFWLVLKKKIFLWYHFSMPCYKLELAERIFFLNSVLNCLLMSYIWLIKKHNFWYFLGVGGGMSCKPPYLISRAFPSNFSKFSFFFLLLISCFYPLRPIQIVLVTSSCGAGRRDKEVWRRKGIRDCSLFSFLLKSILT